MALALGGWSCFAGGALLGKLSIFTGQVLDQSVQRKRGGYGYGRNVHQPRKQNQTTDFYPCLEGELNHRMQLSQSDLTYNSVPVVSCMLLTLASRPALVDGHRVILPWKHSITQCWPHRREGAIALSHDTCDFVGE